MQTDNTDNIVYLNGEYLRESEAKISPLDRGFIFGDGIYEVFLVSKNHIYYLDPHLERLNQSLKNIGMPEPHSLEEWRQILYTLIKKNGSGNFCLYLQVTRGVEKVRKQAFPKDVVPTVFSICFPHHLLSKDELRLGYKAVSVPDLRWEYCHIKATSRLAYLLMFEAAKNKNNQVDEGIIIRDGYALEGTSSNFFMVKNGLLLTPPKSNGLLHGIIRDVILDLAKKNNIPHQEKDILENDLSLADELWISSSSRGIYPILEFNGKPVGSGMPGPLWEQMWDIYDAECNRLSLSIPH